jgi:hypothetical protein
MIAYSGRESSRTPTDVFVSGLSSRNESLSSSQDSCIRPWLNDQMVYATDLLMTMSCFPIAGPNVVIPQVGLNIAAIESDGKINPANWARLKY